MSGTGTTFTVVALTPVEEKKADNDHLLTAIIRVCGVPHARCKTHPIVLALKHGSVLLFHRDFIHMTAASVDALQCEKSGTLVPLELNFKMILRAFLAFCHHQSHKQRRGINILDSAVGQFSNFRNSECDPSKDVAPWGPSISNNKGLADWNKLVKPSARDFKPYREANNWVDCKKVFVIALEAQNLAHLVDPLDVVVDEDSHEAQQKFLCKVFRDNLLHDEAKSVVKFHAQTKDTALIWQKTCKTYDESVSTSLNGDAVLGWLTSSRLDDGKWNRTQGEHVTFCEGKIDNFNEMCPDSVINDMQGVRMLQNSIANVPNLANALISHRQTRTSAGPPDKITLRQFASLLAQQAQVCDNGRI